MAWHDAAYRRPHLRSGPRECRVTPPPLTADDLVIRTRAAGHWAGDAVRAPRAVGRGGWFGCLPRLPRRARRCAGPGGRPM